MAVDVDGPRRQREGAAGRHIDTCVPGDGALGGNPAVAVDLYLDACHAAAVAVLGCAVDGLSAGREGCGRQIDGDDRRVAVDAVAVAGVGQRRLTGRQRQHHMAGDSNELNAGQIGH